MRTAPFFNDPEGGAAACYQVQGRIQRGEKVYPDELEFVRQPGFDIWFESRATGEPYYTYRLVESVRAGERVRQRTLLNLGRHFDVPREQWAALSQHIDDLVNGQRALLPVGLDRQWEEAAQRYAAQVIRARTA